MHTFTHEDYCEQRNCSYTQFSEQSIVERQEKEKDKTCHYYQSSIPHTSGDHFFPCYISQTNACSEFVAKKQVENLENNSHEIANVRLTPALKFSSKDEPTPQLGWFQAFCSIMKQYISIGALTIPFMFYLTGYFLGSLIIVSLGFMTVYSINLIHFVSSDLSKQNPDGPQSHTLGDLSLLLLGQSAQVLFRIFSFISNFGSCIAYMIFFELYIASLVQQHWSHKISNQEAHLIGGLSAFAILFPLSTINHIEMVSHANVIGLIAGFTAISIMTHSEILLIHQTGNFHIDDNKLWQTDNLGVALGIAFFSFKITGISINVRSKMKKTDNFPSVMFASTTITCIIYLFFGITTYLSLGEYTQEIVLLNFSPQTLNGSLARLLYSIGVLLAYPLKFNIVISVYESFNVFKEEIFHKQKEFDTEFQLNFAKLKRYGVRFFLIVAVFLFTLMIHRIAQVIALVGSLGGILNQFVLPQALYLKYTYNKQSWFRISLGVFFSAFCISVSLVGILNSL